jgi:hypothetical protein
MLLQIYPAMKMLLAMLVTSGFSRPWSQSISISSAGAQIISDHAKDTIVDTNLLSLWKVDLGFQCVPPYVRSIRRGTITPRAVMRMVAL